MLFKHLLQYNVQYLALNDWSRGKQLLFFPKNLNVSRGSGRGKTLRYEGNKTNWFPEGSVIKRFIIYPSLTKKNCLSILPLLLFTKKYWPRTLITWIYSPLTLWSRAFITRAGVIEIYFPPCDVLSTNKKTSLTRIYNKYIYTKSVSALYVGYLKFNKVNKRHV